MALKTCSSATSSKASQPELLPLPKGTWVAAVDMGASNLRFARADSRGRITFGGKVRVRPELGPEGVITQIKAGIKSLGRQSGSAVRHAAAPRLEAIAVGV